MPKLGKSHSGAKKRFKVTKKGKVTHDKAFTSHLLTNKGRSQKKFSYGKELTSAKEARKMKALMSA